MISTKVPAVDLPSYGRRPVEKLLDGLITRIRERLAVRTHQKVIPKVSKVFSQNLKLTGVKISSTKYKTRLQLHNVTVHRLI